MASQSSEVEGRLGHSQTSSVGLKSCTEEAVVQYSTLPQEENGEDDAEDWNDDDDDEIGEGTPDWTPSDPSSEEEEGRRSNSGYMLLPQDAEPVSTQNGDDVIHTVEAQLESLEVNAIETVSPRMSKWLQKQVKDAKQGHCDVDWAKFSDPAPARGSKDWPTSAVHSRMETVHHTSSMTVEQVKPHTAMEEGTEYHPEAPQ